MGVLSWEGKVGAGCGRGYRERPSIFWSFTKYPHIQGCLTLQWESVYSQIIYKPQFCGRAPPNDVLYIYKKKNPHSSWCCNLHSLQETTSHESTVQRMMLPTVRQIQLLFLHVRCHRTLECYKTTVRLCSHETCMQGSSKLGLLHLAFIAHLLLSHSKLILSTMNHSTQPRLANSII